jgi:threonine dehydratase
MSVTVDDIHAARARVAAYVRRTPILPVTDRLTFKLEYVQQSGSFKARGAFNRILRAREDGTLTTTGVVAASGGNAGLAVAFAAGVLGVRAEVFVPLIASPVKVKRLEELGAIVHQGGSEYAEAFDAAMLHVRETDALYCHAYDQPEIVAGQGTLGLELADVDTVLVATGGGGLAAGVAVALEGRATVVAVEPELAPTLHAALDAGRPVDVGVGGVAADSLGARRVGSIPFEILARTGTRSVLVCDEAIVDARQGLWRDYRIAVEHGAAAAYAALDSGAYVPAAGERVTVVLCGANTDPSSLA